MLSSQLNSQHVIPNCVIVFFHTTQNCDEYPFSRMETGYCVGLEKRKKYREIK